MLNPYYPLLTLLRVGGKWDPTPVCDKAPPRQSRGQGCCGELPTQRNATPPQHTYTQQHRHTPHTHKPPSSNTPRYKKIDSQQLRNADADTQTPHEGPTNTQREMQRQRHKRTCIRRGSQMHKWTLICKPKGSQNHTYCCTRALKELQLLIKWYVVKPHRAIHSSGGPTPPKGQIPAKGGPIP